MRWLALAALAVAACGDDRTVKSIDAAVDAAPDPSCGCNFATEYCYRIFAGVQPTLGCNTLPAACTATPTCACVTAEIDPCGGALSCDQHPMGITVTCNKI